MEVRVGRGGNVMIIVILELKLCEEHVADGENI